MSNADILIIRSQLHFHKLFSLFLFLQLFARASQLALYRLIFSVFHVICEIFSINSFLSMKVKFSSDIEEKTSPADYYRRYVRRNRRYVVKFADVYKENKAQRKAERSSSLSNSFFCDYGFSNVYLRPMNAGRNSTLYGIFPYMSDDEDTRFNTLRNNDWFRTYTNIRKKQFRDDRVKVQPRRKNETFFCPALNHIDY